MELIVCALTNHILPKAGSPWICFDNYQTNRAINRNEPQTYREQAKNHSEDAFHPVKVTGLHQVEIRFRGMRYLSRVLRGRIECR